MALYNMSRFAQGLLKTHETSPPSFTVRLYREYWTLNNGSKFLYNNQTASLLDDIRAQHIPVDFVELFDAAGLPFYEGCLIVELLDYRPSKSNEPELEQPERTRVVLTPNDESRWADICLMSKKAASPWSDAEALQVEARMLLATEGPLCLEPDMHLTRIVNATQRVSTPPAPLSLKRKAAAVDQEADELEKARRIKLMQFMAPQRNIPPGKFPILDTLQRIRQMKANPQAAATAAAAQQMPTTVPTTASPHPRSGSSAATPVVPPTVPAVALPSMPTQPGPTPTSSTPVPPAAQFHHAAPNASSPAPVSAASPPAPVPNIKKQPPKKKADGVQSPLMPRASVTPAPTAPSGAPLAIPPHLQQHYQAQLAARTGTPQPPVQSVPSPRPASAAHASSPLTAPEQRPPSAVPPAQAQVVQHAQVAQQRPVQPSPAPQVHGQPQQPPVVPGAYTQAQIANALAQRERAAAVAAAVRGQPNGQAGLSQGAAAQQQTQQQQLYLQHFAAYQQVARAHAQAQAAAGQQRLQPGQQPQAAPSPAQNPRSPMPQAQGQPGVVGQRNSPMVTNQQIQPRSPMPNPRTPQQAAQQPQVHQQQQQHQHAQQHVAQGQLQAQHHPQGANIVYANYVRQLAAAQQHPQMQQHLAAVGQPQQQAGQQQAAAAQAAMSNPQMLAQYQHLLNYQRMGMMPPGQVPQGYWMGAGRGMPQNMAGMQGHPQHMQPGAAKPQQGQQGS